MALMIAFFFASIIFNVLMKQAIGVFHDIVPLDLLDEGDETSRALEAGRAASDATLRGHEKMRTDQNGQNTVLHRKAVTDSEGMQTDSHMGKSHPVQTKQMGFLARRFRPMVQAKFESLKPLFLGNNYTLSQQPFMTSEGEESG